MRITSIAYSEYQESPRNWCVEEIDFEAVNLVVGRNAVGKSRLLSVVNALAELVSGRRKPMVTGKYVAEFESKDSTYKYEISFNNNAVTHEHLRGKTGKGRYQDLLKRNEDGTGKIRTKTGRKEYKLINFQSPVNQVGIFSRQDAINHPFLLGFEEWGRSTFHFNFGFGEVREVAILNSLATSEYDPLDTKKLFATFQRGIDEFGDTFKKKLLNDFAKIGYQIDDISIDVPVGISTRDPIAGRLGVIVVKERGIECNIGSHQLSAGMLRAFSLIIQINYRAMAMSPSCFIIDDIGEGLDFERCCSLIDLLMEKSKNSNIQLLMATNDRFVMNQLPLKYWILLDLEGSNVRAMTYRNNRKVFENFKFTGLSNFNFFTQHYARPNNDQD